MNEQYVTLVGKVCAPRYENVFTPEVKSKLPIEATSEGRKLKDWGLYGNNNPNRIDETQDTLPYAVTAYGGDATDWEIYGNNNPVVENKTSTLPIDASATAGNLLDWTVDGNNNIGKNVIQLGESQTRDGVTLTIDSQAGTVIMNGDTAAAESGFSLNLFDTSSLVGGDYIFSGCPDGGSSTTYDLYLYNRTDQVYMGRLYSSSDAVTVTIESGKQYVLYIQCKKAQVYNNVVFKPMLRPANTTSTFEPYQIGVGVRTKNLVDITGYDGVLFDVRWYEDNGQLKASGTYSDNAAHSQPRFYAELSAGTYTLSGSPDYAQTGVRLMVGTCTDAQGSNFAVLGYDTGSGYSFTLQAGSWISVRVYTAASLYQQSVDLILPIMLRPADTTPEFIPHGYEIPMQAKQRTKNNFEIIPSAQIIAETGTLKFTTDAEAGTITANGTAGSTEATVKQRFIVTPELAGRYYFSASFGQTLPSNTYRAYMYNVGQGWTTTWDGTTRSPAIIGDEYQEVLLVEGYTVGVTFNVFANKTVDNVVCKPMLRKADTTPDFEPYYNINQTDIYIGNSPLTQGQSITKVQSGQDITLFSGNNIIDTALYNKPTTSVTYNSSVLGVGEKTENLFDKANCGIIQVDTYGTQRFGSILYGVENGEYTLACDNQSGRALYLQTLKNGTYTITNVTSLLPYTFTVQDIDALILRSTTTQETDWDTLGVYDIMLVKGSTAPQTFIPYGYQIPLLVTSGQQSTPLTIYIGNSPLTSGQSVTKASSGTAITLYQGENTVSTTLGNKPEMRIDYESAEVGVGVRTKNLTDISGVDGNAYGLIVKEENRKLHIYGKFTSQTAQRFKMCPPEMTDGGRDITLSAGSYFLSGANGAMSSVYRLQLLRVESDSSTTVVGYDIGDGLEFTVSDSMTVRLMLNIRAAAYDVPVDMTYEPMLRRADTTAEFEPYGYKIPVKVKERTKNYITWDNYDDTQYNVHCFGENGYLRLVGNYDSDGVHQPFRVYFTLPAGSYVLSGAPDYNTLPIRLAMCTYVDSVSNYTMIGYDQGNGLSFTLSEDSNCFVGVRLQSGIIGVPIDLTLPCMVRKSDTSSDFEPYYSNATQTDIYIGNQPLVSGASVNKDGMGIGIELNEGMNQITTDSYNEPEMYIK